MQSAIMPDYFKNIPELPTGCDFSVSHDGNSVTFAGESRNHSDDVVLEEFKTFDGTISSGGMKYLRKSIKVFLHVIFGLPVIVIACFLVIFPPPSVPYIHFGFLGLWCAVWRFLHVRMGSLPEMEETLKNQAWTLTITPERLFVTQQQAMTATDYRYCSIRDIETVSLNADGYLIATLLEDSTDQEPEITLTGSLNLEDGTWLNQTIGDLVNVLRSAVPSDLQQGHNFDSADVPSGFEVLPATSNSEFSIRFREARVKRVVSSALTIVVGVGLVALFFGVAGKTPFDLKDFPFEKQSANVAAIAGVAMSFYIVFSTLNTLLGQSLITVRSDSLAVQSLILGIGLTRRVERHRIKRLKQIEQPQYHEETEGTIPPVWGLVAECERDIWLLKGQTFSQTDWLGRRLASWFDIPFMKTFAAGETRPIAIGLADYRGVANSTSKPL